MAGMSQASSSQHSAAAAPGSWCAQADLLTALQRCIVDALPLGGATLDAVAATLGFSERTLQRRLHGARLNFQQLVEQLRFDIARTYLRDGELPLTEIGYQLGYSEPSAFSRAFRRWSGASPLAYRRGVLAAERSVR